MPFLNIGESEQLPDEPEELEEDGDKVPARTSCANGLCEGVYASKEREVEFTD